jgi:tetratricopeptide (TPR) repeat protein
MLSWTPLSWTAVGIAACLWGTVIFWYLSYNRKRAQLNENELARREAEIWAWSEEHLLAVIKRFPRSPAPAVEYARHAQLRGEWEEALRRYRLAIACGPIDVRSFAGAAKALTELGRFDEADTLLRKAQRRFPDSSLRLYFAWIAHRRKDWPEAARRWEAYRGAASGDKVGYKQGVQALRMAGRMAEADALAGEAAARFGAPSEPAPPQGARDSLRRTPTEPITSATKLSFPEER